MQALSEVKTLSPEWIANTLAEEVENELASRGLVCKISDEPLVKGYHLFKDALRQQQVTIFVPFSTAFRELREKEATDKIKDWAIFLACKIARPFPLTTHFLELPKGVTEAVEGRSANLVLRMVTDYVLVDDAWTQRFDVLCSWDEPKPV